MLPDCQSMRRLAARPLARRSLAGLVLADSCRSTLVGWRRPLLASFGATFVQAVCGCRRRRRRRRQRQFWPQRTGRGFHPPAEARRYTQIARQPANDGRQTFANRWKPTHGRLLLTFSHYPTRIIISFQYCTHRQRQRQHQQHRQHQH